MPQPPAMPVLPREDERRAAMQRLVRVGGTDLRGDIHEALHGYLPLASLYRLYFHCLQAAPKHLAPGEYVIDAIWGDQIGENGAAAWLLTPQRLLSLGKFWDLSRVRVIESLPAERFAGTVREPYGSAGIVQVRGRGQTGLAMRVREQRRAWEFCDSVDALVPLDAPSLKAATPASAADVVARLKDLAELRASGAITTDEYEALKSRLLSDA